MSKTYDNILSKLLEAKSFPSRENSIKGVRFFIQELENMALLSEDNPLVFSDLIYDYGLIFESDEEVFSNIVPDYHIKSSGLLSQVLEALKIQNYQLLSNNMRDAVYDLHSVLSRKKQSIDSEKTMFVQAVDEINKAIS